MINYQGNVLPEDERKIQIAEARRLSGQETRVLNSKPDARQSQQSRKPNEKTLKGHEAFLDALRSNGTRCRFTLVDGSEITGLVAHADSMTVSVIGAVGELPVVLFKQNLICFTPLEFSKSR